MAYETSYDSGRKPFAPDLQRGYWATPTDFIFICLGFAFKMDFFSITSYFFAQMGVFSVIGIVPYLLLAAVVIVPLMVILMYLGQFSSTGFISAFRISPFFKGMGLVSLFVNISVLIYYGIFATIPLLYIFNAMKPTLPWKCENARAWINQTKISIDLFCNETLTDIIPENDNETMREDYLAHVPSVAFFATHFSRLNFFSYEMDELSFSWELFGCHMLLWIIIALIIYQFYQPETLGRILRYLVFVVTALLVVCLFRFSFLPGAHHALLHFLKPKAYKVVYSAPCLPVTALNAFGSGWGILVALSSHNNFRTNIMRYSWIICVGQMFITLGFGLLAQLIERHFENIVDEPFYSYMESHWILYLSAGSALANMQWANFWSILYFLMLFLACLVVMLTQIFSICTSVYDEFESLRKYKFEFRMLLIATMALISIYFCTNHGVLYFTTLSLDSLVTQLALTLLLLLVVLWIYGRVRLQRDIEFMLSQPFASWKVNILRYVSPLVLCILLILGIYIATFEHMISTSLMVFAAIGLIILPWLFIPGYGILSMLQTTGTLCMRFKRCCRPTDWYPVQPEDRQRYEEALGNMDITHQLNEVLEDVH